MGAAFRKLVRRSTRLTTSSAPRVRRSWNTLTQLLLLVLAISAVRADAAGQSGPANPPTTELVNVTLQSGTIGEIRVVTQGIPNADYNYVSAAAGCTPGTVVLVPTPCTVTVTFQAKAPGIRRGAVVVLDNAGAVMGIKTLFDVGTGSVEVFSPATIVTTAGDGNWLYDGDGGLATASAIFLPGGVAVDPTGSFYISDSGNNRIRRVDVTTGNISTVAGTGSPGSGNDGGLATSASISNPAALLLDGAGDLYIADSANHAVRKLSLATGKLTTIAGRLNQQGYSGDGGLATAALLNTPEGLALDPAGNLFIADTKNNVIRKMDTSGYITTYAGTGAPGFAGDTGPALAARLNTPWGIATDVSGNLLIADLNNNRIRKVSVGGTITTVAGDGSGNYAVDGQPATATGISNPAAVAVDVAGNLYVADSGHNAVRKVSVVTNLMVDVAGNTSPTLGGDKGPATGAGIYGPYALTLDSVGNLYIADIFHHRIREVQSAQATLAYQPIRVGRTSTVQQQTVENDGNSPLNWTSFNPDTNSAISDTTTTCAVTTPLAIDESCSMGAEFFPQVTGTIVTAGIQLLADSVNSPGTITLSGEVDQLDPTQTTISSSVNPSAFGNTITLTANVTGNQTQPSGSVRFYEGTTLLGTSATNSSGTATFNISTLALGTHSLTANFTGDLSDSPSTSTALSQVVKLLPTVALASGLNPSKVGNSVAITATVTASGAQPTGTVAFTEGGNTLATVNLNGSGVATYTPASLTAGTHAITAVYSGDTNTLTGTSSALSQVVDKWSTGTTVGSSASTAVVGTAVTLSVAVTPTSTVIPFGTVVLKDGATVLATLNLDPTGAASYTLSTLAVGDHIITASFAGDPTNAASQSANFTQTTQQISTVTTLAASANPANGGAVLHLTATVLPGSTNAVAGVLDGTVTFTEGAAVLGTGTLSPTGTYTLDISSLSVATHLIKATYNGDTNYQGSASAVLTEQVVLATTSVQLTSSVNPAVAGTGITLTSLVSGNGAVPTGTVNFMDGTNNLGSATINSSGQANLTLSSLPSGTHSIKASYGGDAKDNTSVSPVLTEVVNQATTAVALSSSSNPAIAGTQLTLLATLSSNGSIPSGQMLLLDNAAVIGNAVISPTGAAQFTLSNLTPGSHNLTASFAGDADHVASTSVAVVEVIQYATSAAVLASSQNPGIVGTAVTFTAHVTGTGLQPSGSVSFLDGSTTLATVPLAGTLATFTTSTLTIGAHTITVTYAGDSTHSASSPASVIESIQQSTSTTITSSSNPSIVGAPVTFTATVTGGSNNGITGQVDFMDGSTLLGSSPLSSAGVATLQISSLVAGTHLITASYTGDTNSHPSQSAFVSEAVNTANTSVALVSSANPAPVGTAVTFTATVTSQGKAPSGAITFLDGSTVLGTGNIAGGIATFTTSTLNAGLHPISARYSGDSGTQLSTSSVLLQAEQQHTTVALVSSPNPSLTVQGITLTATLGNGSSATGTYTFSDGSTALGTATLGANGIAAITLPSLAAGTHTLSVHYSGDAYNLAADSLGVTEVVQYRLTTSSITASSQSYLDGQQVTLVTVVHYTGPVVPTGTVVFSAGGQTLGTGIVSGAGAATFTFDPSAASYDIVATYSGDNVYSASTADTYTITKGSSTSFSLTSDPPSFSLKSGDHRTLNLTMADTGGFSDNLSLGCLDLPADATCTFSANQVKLAAGGTAHLTVVFDTGNPLGSGGRATARLNSGGVRNVVSAGLLAPAAILLGILLVAARRGRRLAPLLSVVLLALAGLAVTGCGNSLNTSTTPPGVYNVRIIATGSQTGISQIANVAVTVQ